MPLEVTFGDGGWVNSFELYVELSATFFDEFLVVSVLQSLIKRPVMAFSVAAKNLAEIDC